MNVSDELLDKYFKGLCSPDEARAVAEYLMGTEELPEHLMGKHEWDQLTDAAVTEEKTEEMFHLVQRQTIDKVQRLRWIRFSAAAAIVIGLLSIGFLNLRKESQEALFVKSSQLNLPKENVINWKSIVNYTEHPQLLTLPDQSVVKIYPGAELRYTQPFIRNKREVYLVGKGFFEVTKDKEHPFIVYSKGISTTALGTSFTITALPKGGDVKVQLHTGKVWVKNADSLHQVKTFNKILIPGNELVYNSLSNKVKVTAPKALNIQDAGLRELNFTQASLVDVFAKLQHTYKVKITYNPADLQEMSFTGNLKLTQPIETILEEITELNKLNYIKGAEGYLISK